MTFSADVRRLALGHLALALLVLVFTRLTPAPNAATVAMSFLIVVLLVAATSRLWVAVTTSLAAVMAFNFFFLPPVGTLTIADPQNWIALFALLAVSLVASNLSAVARARTREAEARRDELGRLFDLSRDVLLITPRARKNASLAGFISQAGSTATTSRSWCRRGPDGSRRACSGADAGSPRAVDRVPASRAEGATLRAAGRLARCASSRAGRQADSQACWRRRAGQREPQTSTPSPGSARSPSSALSPRRSQRWRVIRAPELAR